MVHIIMAKKAMNAEATNAKEVAKLQKKAVKAMEKANAAAAVAADASDKVPGVTAKRPADHLLAVVPKIAKIAALSAPRTDPFTVPAQIRQHVGSTAGTPVSSSSAAADAASLSSAAAAPASSSSTAAAPVVVDATGGVPPSMQALVKVLVKEIVQPLQERIVSLEGEVVHLKEKVLNLENSVIVDDTAFAMDMDDLLAPGVTISQDITQMTAAEMNVPLELLRYLNSLPATDFKSRMFSLVSFVSIVPSEVRFFSGLYHEYKGPANLGSLRGVHMERATFIFKEGEGTSIGANTGKHWIKRFRSLRSSMGGEHRTVFLQQRDALLAKNPKLKNFGLPAAWTMPDLAANPFLLVVQHELQRVNDVKSATPAAPYQCAHVMAWGLVSYAWMEKQNPVTKSTGELCVYI